MIRQLRIKIKELVGVISAYDSMISRENDTDKIEYYLSRKEDAEKSLDFFKERLAEHEESERKFE